jgi:hypothetical protein
MKTTAFPFHRYRPVLNHEDVAARLKTLAHDTRQMTDEGSPAAALAGHRYPGRDIISLLLGGWCEFVQVACVAQKGVVLHLSDLSLIEACRNSILPPELTLDDFHLPFPFIEVRFHEDSGLPPAFAVNIQHPDYLEMRDTAWGDWGNWRLVQDEWAGAWVLASAEMRPGAMEHVRSMSVESSRPLVEQMAYSPRSVATDEELNETREVFKILCLSLLLRWEESTQRVPKSVRGLPAPAARRIERRRHMNLMPPKLYTNYQQDAHHSTPTDHHVNAHWRRAHFRVLAHARYKRDEQGRPRVLFIAPTAIHGGGKSERRI